MSYQQTQLSLILTSIICSLMAITNYVIKPHTMNLAIILTSVISIVIACLGYIYIQKKHPLNNEPNAPFVIICFFFYVAIPTSYLTVILLSFFVNMSSILHVVNQIIPDATTFLAIGINMYILSMSKMQRLLDIESEINDDISSFATPYGYLSELLPNIKSYQPPKELK